MSFLFVCALSVFGRYLKTKNFHYIALTAAHILLVRLAALMVIPHKMKRRVDAKKGDLALKGMSVKLRLRPRALKGKHDVSQLILLAVKSVLHVPALKKRK